MKNIITIIFIVLLLAGCSGQSKDVPDPKEDISKLGGDRNCAEKTFDEFDLEGEKGKELVILVAHVAKGEQIPAELIQESTEETINAFVYLLECWNAEEINK